jgi:hypothetical protein
VTYRHNESERERAAIAALHAPAWTTDIVAARPVEAFQTLMRLPETARPRGYRLRPLRPALAAEIKALNDFYTAHLLGTAAFMTSSARLLAAHERFGDWLLLCDLQIANWRK